MAKESVNVPDGLRYWGFWAICLDECDLCTRNEGVKRNDGHTAVEFKPKVDHVALNGYAHHLV